MVVSGEVAGRDWKERRRRRDFGWGVKRKNK